MKRAAGERFSFPAKAEPFCAVRLAVSKTGQQRSKGHPLTVQHNLPFYQQTLTTFKSSSLPNFSMRPAICPTLTPEPTLP
jgi:hypothetical protein